MKAIKEKTTVVLAGAFNPAILQPQWIAVHALGHPEGEEVEVEMVAPMFPGKGPPRRYSFDGFKYSATLNVVTLYMDGFNVAQCERAVLAAAAVLEKLPHTPVSGVGFNFEFLVEEPNADLLSLLTAHPATAESFPGDHEVVTRRWGNTVKWLDCLANIDVVLAGAQATVRFNFHYSTDSAVAAKNVLEVPNAFANHEERAIAAVIALTGDQLEDQP